MTKKRNKKFLSLILSMMLIVAMAFQMTACSDNKIEQPNAEAEGESALGTETENSQSVENNPTDTTQEDVTVLGEGKNIFLFTVTDADGNDKVYEIHTDKTIVGDALLELNLIAGDTAEYGLYVKTVDGITADYDTDGTYWAFYINGEYAMTGVDATPITEGESYAFKVE